MNRITIDQGSIQRNENQIRKEKEKEKKNQEVKEKIIQQTSSSQLYPKRQKIFDRRYSIYYQNITFSVIDLAFREIQECAYSVGKKDNIEMDAKETEKEKEEDKYVKINENINNKRNLAHQIKLNTKLKQRTENAISFVLDILETFISQLPEQKQQILKSIHRLRLKIRQEQEYWNLIRRSLYNRIDEFQARIDKINNWLLNRREQLRKEIIKQRQTIKDLDYKQLAIEVDNDRYILQGPLNLQILQGSQLNQQQEEEEMEDRRQQIINMKKIEQRQKRFQMRIRGERGEESADIRLCRQLDIELQQIEISRAYAQNMLRKSINEIEPLQMDLQVMREIQRNIDIFENILLERENNIYSLMHTSFTSLRQAHDELIQNPICFRPLTYNNQQQLQQSMQQSQQQQSGCLNIPVLVQEKQSFEQIQQNEKYKDEDIIAEEEDDAEDEVRNEMFQGEFMDEQQNERNLTINDIQTIKKARKYWKKERIELRKQESGQSRLQRIYPASLIEENFLESANSVLWCKSILSKKLQISKQSKLSKLFDDTKDSLINSQILQERQITRQLRQKQNQQKDKNEEILNIQDQDQQLQDSQQEQKRLDEQELWRNRDPYLSQLRGQYNAQGIMMAYIDIGGQFILLHEDIDTDMRQRVEQERKRENAPISSSSSSSSSSKSNFDLPFIHDFDYHTSFTHWTTRISNFREQLGVYIQNLTSPATSNQNHNERKFFINVNRDKILESSYQAFMSVRDRRIWSLPVEVRFEGESGIDAGGVRRDWFSNLMIEATSTRTRLFTCRPQNEYRYSIARTEVSMNPLALQLYNFIGLVLGKAAQLQDIFSIDPELGTQLMQKQYQDVTEYGLRFEVQESDYDEINEKAEQQNLNSAYKGPIVRTVELVPNGSNVPLTNYNKDAYVRLRIQRRLTIGIQAQLEQMREGFQHLVSPHFNKQQELEAEDIELLLQGHTDIDVQDWQESTIVEPSSDTNSQLINWFWDIVRTDFTDQKRRQLLRFATGSPAPPQEGFAFLLGQNSNRLTPFKIQILQFQNENMLPISHTCFNQIDLPRYRSKEQLKMKLIFAIEQTNDGILNA